VIVARFFAAIWNGLRDPEFRALFLTVGGLLGAGTLVYHRYEGWSVLDSLYFSVITLTTVGYGDLAPTRPGTKIFTIVFIITGIGILLAFINLVAKHALQAPTLRERLDRRRRKSAPDD
jgi:voltage-gated potassium channel Kch